MVTVLYERHLRRSLKGNPESWKFGEKNIDELRILQRATTSESLGFLIILNAMAHTVSLFGDGNTGSEFE